MDNMLRINRIVKSVTYLTTVGYGYRTVHERDGLTDFCNLVRYQLSNPNMKLQEAFENVVYMTKNN